MRVVMRIVVRIMMRIVVRVVMRIVVRVAVMRVMVMMIATTSEQMGYVSLGCGAQSRDGQEDVQWFLEKFQLS